ncbi:hypothetical protein AB0J74_32900 [Asanoa sp. NPDC049573]|uniref:hypothetical protein n=1 Tax=Asanoa sp. NPDC049573 TaxID=3155396 RepID=UPI00341BC7B7
MGTDIQLSALRLGKVLGEGAEGQVFALPDRPDDAYKRYRTVDIDAEALAAVIDFPHRLSAVERRVLMSGATWPAHRVVDGTRTVGFVMRRIPPRFLGRTAASPQQPRQLQYLMFARTGFWGDILPLDAAARIGFLRATLAVFRVLHAHGAVVGDVSQANVLWSDAAETLVIDCDGVRLAGGTTVLPPKETIDWTDHTLSGPPDLASDRYKIANLIMRVMTASADTEPPEASTPAMPGVPHNIAEACRVLYRRAALPRDRRPTVEEWDRALRGLDGRARTPAVPRQGVPVLDVSEGARPPRTYIATPQARSARTGPPRHALEGSVGRPAQS